MDFILILHIHVYQSGVVRTLLMGESRKSFIKLSACHTSAFSVPNKKKSVNINGSLRNAMLIHIVEI